MSFSNMGGSSSFETNPNADPIDEPIKMTGVWYVIESNLAVWNGTGRICPTIVYEPMEPTQKEKDQAAKTGKPPPFRCRDITEYRNGGTLEKQSKSVSTFLGIDTLDEKDPLHTIWKWKGTGGLCLLSCPWQMVKHNAEYTWAIVTFGETTFTKAGCDIYYREPVMPPELMAEIKQIIANDPYLKRHGVDFVPTIQDPRGRRTD